MPSGRDGRLGAMDSFRWVSVLMSMLLGLGLATLLNGVVTVLRAARPRRLDWLPLAWAGAIFLAHLQYWWAINQMPHGLPSADFPVVVGLVLFTLLLSAAAVLLLPGREAAEPGLRVFFAQEGRWALAALGAFLLASLPVNWLLFDLPLWSGFTPLTLALAAGPLLVAFARSRRLMAWVTAIYVPCYVLELILLSDAPLLPGAFRWLSVILSMILGLGVTRLLTGLVVVLRARREAPLDWLPLVWAANVFVVQLQYWWAVNNLPPDAPDFTFPTFVAFLVLPTALYLASVLLLPGSRSDEAGSLATYFRRSGRWSLVVLAGYFALATVGNWTYFDVPVLSFLTFANLPMILLPLLVAFSSSRSLRAAVTLAYLPLHSGVAVIASYGY